MLYLDSLLARKRGVARLHEREARVVAGPRACCAAPAQIALALSAAAATKLPERSSVRISPLSLSTWIARDAVTTETPYAEATSRELGTLAPSRRDHA